MPSSIIPPTLVPEMETAEIYRAPQGVGIGLKHLNWEACSSLAGGITKTGMHHFP